MLIVAGKPGSLFGPGVKMKKFFLSAIRVYQMIPKLRGACCRYYPSCSQYMYDSVEEFGIFYGGWMGLKRLGRCHPFHPGGYDPAPKKDDDKDK